MRAKSLCTQNKRMKKSRARSGSTLKINMCVHNDIFIFSTKKKKGPLYILPFFRKERERNKKVPCIAQLFFLRHSYYHHKKKKKKKTLS